MSFFVMCRGYESNVEPLLHDADSPKVTILHYDTAVTKRTLPRGTYIFTGIDRLGVTELSAESRVFRRLR